MMMMLMMMTATKTKRTLATVRSNWPLCAVRHIMQHVIMPKNRAICRLSRLGKHESSSSNKFFRPEKPFSVSAKETTTYIHVYILVRGRAEEDKVVCKDKLFALSLSQWAWDGAFNNIHFHLLGRVCSLLPGKWSSIHLFSSLSLIEISPQA